MGYHQKHSQNSCNTIQQNAQIKCKEGTYTSPELQTEADSSEDR